MNRYVMIMLIGLGCSCSTVKKQNAKVLKETTKKLALKEQQLSHVQKDLTILDSGQIATEFTFLPKGIVKYSAANGFEGEAHQISIKSRTKQHHVLQAGERLTTQNHKSLAHQQQELLKAKTATKTKTQSYSWLLMEGVLFCLGIAAIYFAYRRKLFG